MAYSILYGTQYKYRYSQKLKRNQESGMVQLLNPSVSPITNLSHFNFRMVFRNMRQANLRPFLRHPHNTNDHDAPPLCTTRTRRC
jgi:hypothetical protein